MNQFKNGILFNLLIVIVFLISGCKKNNQDIDSSNVQVGDSYQGGIVSYLFTPGDNGYARGFRGIIIAENDLPARFIWKTASATDLLSTLSIEIGYGDINSKKILELSTSLNFKAPAVEEATKYQGGNFNDWFLPTEKELIVIKTNIADKGQGNFIRETYWSSSVMTNLVGAKAVQFLLNAGICGCSFAESYLVRPVRYFK
jgi:hypothetical protein